MASALIDENQELEHNAIGLLQSTVIAIAASAPGQATALSLAAIITASAYGGGAAIIITTVPMLAIAYSYYRLNLWNQNCGATYEWVGRSISPYLGFMVGWIMLAGIALGEVSNILPLGPALLSLFGMDPNSQWGTVITATILAGGVMALAAIGIQITARFQMLIAGIEYLILAVFSVIGFWAVFVIHIPGSVHPTAAWLSPFGVGGKGTLVAGALVAVYLFTGWDTSIYLNEETERKEVNPGKAVIIGVAVLGVFYTILTVTLQGAASAAKMNAQGGSAMIYAAHQFVGSPWDKFMALAIVLSIMGTTQAILVATARVAFSMGRDHVLPKVFGSIADRFRTPFFGTVFFGVLCLIALWAYIFSSSIAGAFNTVLALVGVLFAIFYAVTGLATTWFYRRIVTRSASDLFFNGIAPVGGAIALLYVAEQSIQGFTGPEQLTLVGLAVAGLVMMAIAVFVYRAPFFQIRRESYQPEAAPEPVPAAPLP